MTTQEFSDQFDVLYNNITSNQAPGLNEYEKSVFLTKAQEEIVKNYFNPKSNPKQDGFDDSPKRQADFTTLMQVATLQPTNSYAKFDSRSDAFKYPDDFFIAVNEQFQISVLTTGKIYPYNIVPISYEEYARLMQKPYKYPPKNQVWRLITGRASASGTGYWVKTGQTPVAGAYSNTTAASLANSGTTYANIAAAEADGWRYLGSYTGSVVPIVEIIGRYNPSGSGNYKLRYIRRPNPIILVGLSTIDNSLSINGQTSEMGSELPEHVHEEILQRAVELAKIAWAGEPAATVQAGQRSE